MSMRSEVNEVGAQRINAFALSLRLRNRALHAGKCSLAMLKRMLPRRKRVAVLIEKNEDIATRQILQRAAEHFCGIGGVTFEIRSFQPTLLNIGLFYLRFEGVLLSGGYRDMAELFARMLPTYDVDPRREPDAMWNWHYVISVVSPITPQRIDEARVRFANALSQL